MKNYVKVIIVIFMLVTILIVLLSQHNNKNIDELDINETHNTVSSGEENIGEPDINEPLSSPLDNALLRAKNEPQYWAILVIDNLCAELLEAIDDHAISEIHVFLQMYGESANDLNDIIDIMDHCYTDISFHKFEKAPLKDTDYFISYNVHTDGGKNINKAT